MWFILYFVTSFLFHLSYEFHIDVTKNENIIYNGNKINASTLYNFLKSHEKILIFGNDKQNYRYKIVNVKHKVRKKRSVEKIVNLNIGEDEKEIQELKLIKSQKLLDESFVYIQRYENNSQFIENSEKLAEKFTDCFYRNENAAFDVCDGNIKGIIRQDDHDLIIHPLPERFGKDAHIIFEPTTNPYENFFKNHQEFEPSEDSQNEINIRSKRYISSTNKIPNELHIETAIFVDKDLFRHMAKNFPKNTEMQLIRFVLAMVNGVQLLYHHPSLGRKINFILKRLEILYSDPKELRRSSDIDVFLNSFCSWQRKLNPVSDADIVHFDHAVILTGLDLYVVSKNGKVSSQVVGLAPVAGMCTQTSSCTINEGKHFESVYVVAHEIGHNLGMRHDTSEGSCDPSLFIMSPTLGSGKITWSKCSREYLNNFLKTSQSKCLFDRGHFGPSLDHSAEGILPGERFDADQQCMLKYGKDSIRSRTQPIGDICRDLHCQRDRYTWTSHPALEGTNCGEMMRCKSGICSLKSTLESFSIPRQVTVKSAEQTNLIDDRKYGNLKQELNTLVKLSSWSEWGLPTECESGCLYGESGRLREGSTGLKIYSRSCMDYRFRKKCIGQDKMYEACTAKQCHNIARTTVLEFANQICQRAKTFDSDIIGIGIQKVGNSPEDSCKVFCESKIGPAKSRLWTFPDGTSCQVQNSDIDDTYYCVNGRCEHFLCNKNTTQMYLMDEAFCPQNLILEEVTSSTTVTTTTAFSYDLITPMISSRVQQENGRDYKSIEYRKDQVNSSSSEKIIDLTKRPVALPRVGFQKPVPTYHNIWRMRNYDNPLISSASNNVKSSVESIWTVKSGCHFSCMEQSAGVQVISSKLNSATNIQLCSPDILPCDNIQTTYQFATNLCSKYRFKVRGLSGSGMQISPSVNDPDRGCKVACQDEYIYHRFYLVNGDQGYFPFGTKCSKTDNRYCVNGKCLEFGPDGVPLDESHISLAIFRNKRDLSNRERTRRNFLYYNPTNITEKITQSFIEGVVESIDFAANHDVIVKEKFIDLHNPIYISADELT